jgi:hypothetical protein
LPPVKKFDPVARESKRIERWRVAGLNRRIDFSGGNAQAAGVQIEAVEPARRLDQRRIAASRHVVDDDTGRAFDIGGYLAFHGEKSGESLGEIGAASV